MALTTHPEIALSLKKVELCLYSPFGSSWPFIAWTLHLHLYLFRKELRNRHLAWQIQRVRFIAVTEDWRNSASDIKFICNVCSQRLFEAVSGAINISSYSLAADRIAWMSARSIRCLTVNKIWNVWASFAKTSHPDRWIWEFFNFSLRTHRKMSSWSWVIVRIVKKWQNIEFQVVAHDNFECHGNSDYVKKKKVNAHHTFSSPENTGSSLEVLGWLGTFCQ